MELTEELPENWAGCQGADCCPLASELRKYDKRIRKMERRFSARCGRLGELLMEAAGQLMEMGYMPQPPEQINDDAVVRECICLLMEAIDDHGHYLVSHRTHWQAIYRILVDKGIGVADGDYKGFGLFVQRIGADNCRVPFSLTVLRQISKSNFTKPFERWTFDPAYFKTRTPYDRMVAVAKRFKEILEKHGL